MTPVYGLAGTVAAACVAIRDELGSAWAENDDDRRVPTSERVGSNRTDGGVP